MDKQIELLRAVRQALQSNDYARAIASLEEVVDLAESRGDISAKGRHLGNLALTYYRTGKHELALTYFEEALACARENKDRLTENGLLGNMGNILREVQRYDDAVRYLNDALLIAQELGDTRGRGIWLSNLGLVYDDLEQYEEARNLHEKSVTIARSLYDRPALALRLHNLGNSLTSLKQNEKAIAALKEALAIQRELGRIDAVAQHAQEIGDLYLILGRALLPDKSAYIHFNSALEHYSIGLKFRREIGDEHNEADILYSVGLILMDAQQTNDARQYLEQALTKFQSLGLEKRSQHAQQMLKKLSMNGNTTP